MGAEVVFGVEHGIAAGAGADAGFAAPFPLGRDLGDLARVELREGLTELARRRA